MSALWNLPFAKKGWHDKNTPRKKHSLKIETQNKK